jgi:anti-anti-sigma regulatory factor
VSVRFDATVTGRIPGDHVCWPFHGMDDLVPAAREYVAEGLDRHEQVSYWKVDPAGIRHSVISDVREVGTTNGAGLPVVTPLATEPRSGPWIDPTIALGQMTQAALDAGYTGRRVLTDATDVVRDPGTRPWWVRGEHQIDRYGLDRPLAVLCGYDAELVGDETLGEVACLHALTGGMPSTFLLRADDTGGLALVGEVDRASVERLHHVVMTIADDLARPVRLDLSEHEFIDHSALVALDNAATALRTRIELVGASALTTFLVDLLELTGVTAPERP